MPMDRALYPHGWPQIARQVKERADWCCQGCGKQCYRPGERVYDWRSVLTVAHLDHNPGNNAPDNLKALCVVRHLNYDRAEHVARAKRTWALKRAGPTIPLPL